MSVAASVSRNQKGCVKKIVIAKETECAALKQKKCKFVCFI